MITRLRINNFKSFKDDTVFFTEYNLLIGANGAGKTNLVKALDFLAHIVRTGTLNNARKFLGVSGVDNIPNIYTGLDIFGFEIDIETEQGNLKYQIQIKESDDSMKSLSVVYEKLIDQNGDGVFERRNNNIVNNEGVNIPLNIENKDIAVSLYKENKARIFKNKISQLFLSNNVDYEDREFVSTSPRNFSFLLNKIYEKGNEEYKSFEIIAKKIIKGFDGFEPLTPALSQKDPSILFFLRQAETKKWFTTYSSSTGDMKTFYLLAALFAKNTNSTLIIEEIENGLHPKRMKLLLEHIQNIATKRDLQLIITTHSPDIIDVTSPNKILFLHTENGFSTVSKVDSHMTSEIESLLTKGGDLSDYLNLFIK